MKNAFTSDIGVMHAGCQGRHDFDTAFPVEAGRRAITCWVEVNLFHFSSAAPMSMVPENFNMDGGDNGSFVLKCRPKVLLRVLLKQKKINSKFSGGVFSEKREGMSVVAP